MDKFSQNLKRIRDKKGITAKEIAIDLGLPYTTYLKYEGAGEPRYDTLIKIADYLNVSIDELLGYKPNDAKENKYAKYIRTMLDNRTLLEQLAEECSELSKASLKMIRAMGRSNNITPVSPGQAMDNFREEIMDVLSVIALIEGGDSLNGMVYDIPYNPKLKRWAERLGYEEGD